MTEKLKIEEMFAFVADDPKEGEGVMGFYNENDRTWMPLVGADMARMGSIKQVANMISKHSGKPWRLLKFSVREQLDEYKPEVTDGQTMSKSDGTQGAPDTLDPEGD